MLVLAIDTCLARCAVCVFDSTKNQVLAEARQDMERGHAEALAPMVQRAIAAAGQHLKNLDRIALTTGPGTFTGLRIGLSFARALGLALNIPVLGLATLHAFRLGMDAQRVLALSAGHSNFAYVLRLGSDAIELVPISGLENQPLLSGFPDLARLANWASAQPIPAAMPEPVYIREPDAKLPIMVRPVAAEAAAALSAVHHAVFSRGWPTSEIAQMFAIAGTQGFLAEIANEPAGMVLTRTIAAQAEILTIATLPARQRTGIGAKLLNHAIAAARALGARTLFLEVAQSNISARNLYLKAGLAETGRRQAYYSNGEDAIVMSRSLP